MYTIAPFYFEKLEDRVLITNDMGNHLFLTHEAFNNMLTMKLKGTDPLYDQLMISGFIFKDRDAFLRSGSEQLISMKKCLFTSTQLFILVLTNSCNQLCSYCQAGKAKSKKMSVDTCKKAIEIAAQSPTGTITIEFQGGEPTLNPDVIRFAIPYARNLLTDCGKKVNFALVTNLTEPNPKLLEYLIEEDVCISTSLDGPKSVHDYNRPLAIGSSSYDSWSKGMDVYNQIITKLGKNRNIGAIQTTTKESLHFPRKIVDEYIKWGFHSLYIRPLTPLGKAAEHWNQIGYTAEEFISFYKAALNYIIELCVNGSNIVETTASLYLSRMVCRCATNHTEFRSPCGAAIGQMAVNYDGNIYTCDEGRMVANMGDSIFQLGTVNDSYKSLLQSPAAHAVCSSSCVEALPFCSDCAYHPFCSVCPVVNYGMEHDLISRELESYRCKISKGIISYLLHLLHNGSDDVKKVLYLWAR